MKMKMKMKMGFKLVTMIRKINTKRYVYIHWLIRSKKTSHVPFVLRWQGLLWNNVVMVLSFPPGVLVLNLSSKGKKFKTVTKRKKGWLSWLKNSREIMVNIDFCDDQTPWSSANATHGQIGWGLYQRGWSNDMIFVWHLIRDYVMS